MSEAEDNDKGIEGPNLFLRGEQMSMRQSRQAGQNYIANKITSLAIEDLSWDEAYNQDISELTVASGGKKKTYMIDNLDLEDPQRRNCLDQIAELIINEFS